MQNNENFEDDGKVSCQECGSRFRMITQRHVERHNMTLQQYKFKYPDAKLSGSAFSASQRYAKTKLFKKEDEPNKEDEINVSKLVEELGEDNLYDDNQLEEYVVDEPIRMDLNENKFEKKFNKTFKNTVIQHKQKIDILKYLFFYYPNIKPDYFVEVFRHDDVLIDRLITDIAIPNLKIAFFFPKVFWHNEDYPPDPNKYEKLKSYGWECIIVKESDPFAHIDKYLDEYDSF